MRVKRDSNDSPFVPYSIQILIDEPNDEALLRNMLSKLTSDVKPGGIYYGIVSSILACLNAQR